MLKRYHKYCTTVFGLNLKKKKKKGTSYLSKQRGVGNFPVLTDCSGFMNCPDNQERNHSFKDFLTQGKVNQKSEHDDYPSLANLPESPASQSGGDFFFVGFGFFSPPLKCFLQQILTF